MMTLFWLASMPILMDKSSGVTVAMDAELTGLDHRIGRWTVRWAANWRYYSCQSIL